MIRIPQALAGIDNEHQGLQTATLSSPVNCLSGNEQDYLCQFPPSTQKRGLG